jgi:hypothetical protein
MFVYVYIYLSLHFNKLTNVVFQTSNFVMYITRNQSRLVARSITYKKYSSNNVLFH